MSNKPKAKAASAPKAAQAVAAVPVISFDAWREAMLTANRLTAKLFQSAGTNNMLNVPQLSGKVTIAGKEIEAKALKDASNLQTAFNADAQSTFGILTRGDDFPDYLFVRGGLAVAMAILASKETGKRRKLAETVIAGLAEYYGYKDVSALYASLGEAKKGRKSSNPSEKIDLSAILAG